VIVVAGESLIDLVLDHDGDTSETPGGSPLNVAVGLARLEVPATLISQVGHDEHGGMVVQHVEASGATMLAVPTSSGRTSVATARLDATGAAQYEFDLDWSLPRQELPPCHALHVGSLGTVLEPGRQSVRDLVEQGCARDLVVTYDANLRASFVEDRDRTCAAGGRVRPSPRGRADDAGQGPPQSRRGRPHPDPGRADGTGAAHPGG